MSLIVPDAFDKLFCRCNGSGASFSDDSTANPKTITANGNATQLSLHADFAGKRTAAFFNGTTDYVVVPDSADWDFGTGDFNITGYFNFSKSGVTQNLIDMASDQISLVSQATTLRFEIMNTLIAEPNWAPTLNTWYKISARRVSGQAQIFVDDVQLGTDVANSSNVTGSSDLYIGTASTPGDYFGGWMKNLTVTKAGTTVLDMKFDSPATSPLAPAIYFDGTGDYLSLADSDDWDFGAGAFDIQAFACITDTSTGTARTIAAHYGSAGNRGWWLFWNQPSNELWFQYTTDGTNEITTAKKAYTPTINKWVHFRVCRVGVTLYFYADGKSLGTIDFTGVTIHGGGTALLTVGASTLSGGEGYFIGYLREVIVQKGSSGTSTGFTPSQTGLTVTPNTKLYLIGDEDNGVTTFIDSTFSPKTVTTAGDTKIKYTESYLSCIFKDEQGKFPYSIGSAKVDFFSAFGSGVYYGSDAGNGYLSTDDHADFDMGTGVATYETFFRFYAAPTGGNDYTWLYTGASGIELMLPNNGFRLYVANLTQGDKAWAGAETPLINTWFHLAFVRTSATAGKVFFNGTQVGTDYDLTSKSLDSSATVQIGYSAARQIDALMDNIRISKGIARYAATFNPPEDVETPISNNKSQFFALL